MGYYQLGSASCPEGPKDDFNSLTVLLYKLSLKHKGTSSFFSSMLFSIFILSKKKGREICSLSHFSENSLYIPFVKLLQLYTIYHTNPHLHYSSLHKEIVFLTFYLGPYLSKRQTTTCKFLFGKESRQPNQPPIILHAQGYSSEVLPQMNII